MSGGVGSIPRSKDGIGNSSRNNHRVGGRMSDPGQGCGAGGGMVRSEERRVGKECA